MSTSKNGGFTLVELVVVIAILAILAGISVPAYGSYMKKAEQAADLVVCEAVKVAVYAAYLDEDGSTPDSITIVNGTVTLDEKYQDDFNDYISGTTIPADLNATWSRTTSAWEIQE